MLPPHVALILLNSHVEGKMALVETVAPRKGEGMPALGRGWGDYFFHLSSIV